MMGNYTFHAGDVTIANQHRNTLIGVVTTIQVQRNIPSIGAVSQ